MCGIVGSPHRKIAFALYQANLTRGRYSAGMLTFKDGIPMVKKTKGEFKLEDFPEDANYYLVHSRAPTGKNLEYSDNDTHPFELNGMYVAHNGIISNADQIAQECEIDYSDPKASLVDSYVIPHRINYYKKKDYYNDHAVIQTLTDLKGIFGVWIYMPPSNLENDSKTGTIFIARNSSTLYMDPKQSTFSSNLDELIAELYNMKMVTEGQLYAFKIATPEDRRLGIFPIAKFKTKPLYYIAAK